MTPEQLVAKVRETRAAQGLPARVEDDAALAKVAAVLAASRPRQAAA